MSAQGAGRGACILAWLAAILIPAALVVGIGMPWSERMGELEREIASRADQLDRYRRLLDTLPGLRAELAKVSSNEDVKAFYYEAQTPALAGAQLQREIQDMVKAAGGRLISTQILPAAENERPPKVQIRTQLQGGTDALLDVLYRIEEARPFLFVDQVSVRSATRRIAQPNPLQRGRPAPAQAQEQLTFRLDIFGYVLGASR